MKYIAVVIVLIVLASVDGDQHRKGRLVRDVLRDRLVEDALRDPVVRDAARYPVVRDAARDPGCGR